MNYAVILSGGVGTRMRSDGFPKQYLEINGKPVLLYTLMKFQQCDAVDEIIIVAAEQWQIKISEWIKLNGISKFKCFASPGDTRQGSILNGLLVCSEDPKTEDTVIIHDAVRPLVSEELITKCFESLKEYEGCLPVIPVTDTIYYSETGKNISQLFDRSKLYGGQAPEAFRFKEYLAINTSASKDEIDSTKGTSEIAFNHGMSIAMIPGEVANFKLTTPEDLERFRAIMEKE